MESISGKHTYLLLKYGTYDNYFDDIFKETTIDSIFFENEYKNKLAEKIEPHMLEIEWDTKEQEFKNDGYTKDDVQYYDKSEAIDNLKEECIEEIALRIINDYLNKDEVFFVFLVSYIKRRIQELVSD